MNKTKLFQYAAAMTFFMAFNSVADVAVVVNPGNAISEISVKDAQRLYLGKTGKFPGGSKAEVFDQSGGQGSRAVFYDKVVGKSESQAKSYWSKQIFTGKGTPPEEVGGDGDIKAKVSANPMAIGYMDASQVDSSVKAVLVVQ